LKSPACAALHSAALSVIAEQEKQFSLQKTGAASSTNGHIYKLIKLTYFELEPFVRVFE
jgi:hypothetical protein